jgi:hypothetical protein
MYGTRAKAKEDKLKRACFIGLVFLMVMVSCNTSYTVDNAALPKEFKTLEVWNGGAKIAAYKNVTMNISSISSSVLVGKNISFYIYHITGDAVDEYVIDSEALALKYTVE